jgi:hypothetical protein
MPRRHRRIVGLAAVVLLLCAVRAEADAKIDSKATEQLRKMSEYLARQQQFAFQADATTQVIMKTGEKIDLDIENDVAVQRPNMLRSERSGAANAALYYDGRQVTFYGKQDNAYATTEAPPTLDEMIDFARDKLGLEAPGADLLYGNPYAVLMEDVIGATYLGKTIVRDVPCHHMIFRGRETDWQIWISEGSRPLPIKWVIVSKKMRGSPEFRVELSRWNLEPNLDASAFQFMPPKDAKRVEFADVPYRVGAGR